MTAHRNSTPHDLLLAILNVVTKIVIFIHQPRVMILFCQTCQPQSVRNPSVTFLWSGCKTETPKETKRNSTCTKSESKGLVDMHSLTELRAKQFK